MSAASNPGRKADPSRDAGRCGTHLHEITLWGVEGKGASPMEAAQSWRCAAKAALMLETDDAA